RRTPCGEETFEETLLPRASSPPEGAAAGKGAQPRMSARSGSMNDMDLERMLREQRRMLWATAVCFALGLLAGTAVLWGASRPFSGDGSVIIPVALVAGVIAAAAFVVSTRIHRPGETGPMPPWQAAVSNI